MFKNLMLFALIFQSLQLYSQPSIGKIEEKIKKAGYFSDIGQSDKSLILLLEAEKMSRETGYKKGELRSGQMLVSIYKNRGEYRKSLKSGIRTEELARELGSTKDLVIINQTKSMIYNKLGFQKQSLIEVRKAIEQTEKLEDDLQHFYMSLNYENFAGIYEEMQKQDSVIYYLQKSLSELESIRDDSSEDLLNFKYDHIMFTNLNIGNYYTGIYKPQRLDLAEIFYLKALSFKDTQSKLFKKHDQKIYNSLGRFYNIKKEYSKAIEYAEKALDSEKKSKDPNARRLSYGILSDAYEGILNKEKNLEYLKLYTYITDSLHEAGKSSVSIPLNQTVLENEQKNIKKINSLYIIYACVIFSILLGGFLFWKRSIAKLKHNYETVIHTIKGELDGKDKENIPVRPRPSLIISDETVKNLIANLEKFEETHEFIKKDVTLSYLSSYLNTNNRYLSEILKTYRDKTFSRYINSLRIKYIIKLLYLEPRYREYKIDALADMCGFSSREVFGLAFKKETGITPSYYINQLKKTYATSPELV